MFLTFLGSGDAFSSGGRFNSCLKLEAGGTTMLIDIGATAMLAMVKAGVDGNAVSTILLTHFHGDHFAGLPFFILDAMFVSRRTAPLTIAGPRGVEGRVRTILEAMYPGFVDRPRGFELNFREISPGALQNLGVFAVEAFPMIHDEAAGPCQGYRISHGGKTFAFTGDTGWTEALIPLAEGADLLVSECCFVELAFPSHLNWRQLEAARPRLTARRFIVTHMGPDMLAYDGAMFAEKAFDGMRVEI